MVPVVGLTLHAWFWRGSPGRNAGVTVSGVLMAIFQSNAGGAWDNAKKSFPEGR